MTDTCIIRPDPASLTMPRFDHDIPFDPTYGYDVAGLLAVAPPDNEPDDFAAFWQATYEQAMAIKLNITRRHIDSPWPEVHLYEVEYDSLDGVRIGGWMLVPVDETAIEAGMVVGHGYGGREGPVAPRRMDRQVTLLPCARGFHRSAHDNLPSDAAWHVIHGIDQRETYLHRGCVADYWLAVSVICELYPQAASRLFYEGGSFGGGIGAMMMAWDTRLVGGSLHVPSFGNHPLRVSLDCRGSGAAVRVAYQHKPAVLDVLAYYDAATAAKYIRVPVTYVCAMFDPAVPPPGQFCVFNAQPTPKALYIHNSGHFDNPTPANNEQAATALIEDLYRLHQLID